MNTVVTSVLRFVGVAGPSIGCILLAGRTIARRWRARFLLRPKEPADSFLDAFGSSVGTRDATLIIEIRETLAEMGEVPADLIRHNDTFRCDLKYLKFSDDFDMHSFADYLARRTGLALTEAQLDQIPHLDVAPRGLTVKDFVNRVLAAAGFLTGGVVSDRQGLVCPPSDVRAG